MPNPLEQYSANCIRRILLKNGEIGEMVLTMLWGEVECLGTKKWEVHYLMR